MKANNSISRPALVSSAFAGRRTFNFKCHASQQPESPPPSSGGTRLGAIIKRKQQQLAQRLEELGEEGLEERLQSAASNPSAYPYRLARLIADTTPTGRPVLVFEIARTSTSVGQQTDTTTTISSSKELAEVATRLSKGGADALIVPTDSEDTPEGLSDLFNVSRAAAEIRPIPPPVLCRDWFLHPLQIVDAKEAGCAGVVGIIASVTGARGTPVMSSFSSALGLDAPVEIVNLAELKAMETFGVPFFALNISVGLSVRIAGFGSDVAAGLLGELPFMAVSLVGVKSLEEARAAREAGADALFVRRELVWEWQGREKQLVEALIDATNGDD
ncbi:hypothetical protein Ndes2526B_g05168 [Nannochloris sp. 'desiccata']|nr:hypothetical protein NADE_008200 [Chlorella desiccata (nom. nud.)]